VAHATQRRAVVVKDLEAAAPERLARCLLAA